MNAAHLTRRTLRSGRLLRGVCPRADRTTPVVAFRCRSGWRSGAASSAVAKTRTSRCTVVAPRFEGPTSPIPSADALEMRIRRLRIAFLEVAQAHLPATGVGHSMEATLLLMLVGSVATTMAAETIGIPSEQQRSCCRYGLLQP